jgi:hypothetical protein
MMHRDQLSPIRVPREGIGSGKLRGRRLGWCKPLERASDAFARIRQIGGGGR